MKRSEDMTSFTPLAERMRPQTIDEIIGQEHILAPDKPLGRAIRKGKAFSVVLWGPPGSGKTTLARLMGLYSNQPFKSFSAVTSGLKELRTFIEEANSIKEKSGSSTILFVDEIHRFNKAQQDAFLPYMESGLIILVGATTQNPSFEVIPPLLSRSRVFIMKPLEREHIEVLLHKALTDKERGLGNCDIKAEKNIIEIIAKMSYGDARSALNNLEVAADYVMSAAEKEKCLTIDILKSVFGRYILPHDKNGEEHYNLISAFHKSMRGSDVNASLYWLYRMLEAGEDPLFIARRMIRFASEDVGLADPQAIQISIAAFETWEKIGPPEAKLALAQAAVYLASAPKSNALYLAEKEVIKEINKTGPLPVPLHIRNAPTALMQSAGYAKGYLYPHNYSDAWINQKYLPDGISSSEFYSPSPRGFERDIKRRIDYINSKKDKTR